MYKAVSFFAKCLWMFVVVDFNSHQVSLPLSLVAEFSRKKNKNTRAYIEKMWNSLLQVDKSDPNAVKTLSRLEAAQKSCRESGALNKRFVNLSTEHWMVFFFYFFFWLTLRLSSTRKSYIIRNESKYNSVLVSFCWIVNLISSRVCLVASFLFQAIHLFLITCYAYKFQHRAID